MARRNANGEGSISRRKDGRWEGAVYVLTTSGTQKRLRVYGKTRSEAHQKLVTAKAKQQQGVAVADKMWRLGEYLDYWLDKVVRPNRRRTTYERYESNVRLTLKPHLGHHVIARLSVPIVQTYLNRLQDEGKSRRQVQIIREVLSSALTSAMREEVVTRNVARLVVLPGREQTSITPWTSDEAIRFLAVARNHRLYSAFVLLLFYGLRRGEVLGLRWQDIDFERGELRIEQQISRASGVVQAGPVKTQAGRRRLPLLVSVRSLLLDGHNRSLASSDLVYRGRSGDKPINPPSFTEIFQRICEENGVRRIKLHHLRHTTATLLKRLRVPARDTQLILGHSHISTTQQVYQHDDMDSRREALEQLEQLLTTDSAGNLMFSDRRDASALPSKLPSSIVSSFQQQENTPDTEVFSMVTLPGIEYGPPNLSHCLAERLTAVDRAVRARRRLCFLGAAAVNLAVKIDQPEDAQKAA